MNVNKLISLYAADICLPYNQDMTRWSVVACDQYTSQPQYWEEVEAFVGELPSAYSLVLPEIYLNDYNVDEKINEINKAMEEYGKSVFKVYKNSLIYVERTMSNGKTRCGIIGAVDLEDYEYIPGNSAKIRATEGTVAERIPPRVRVRENALYELPHIMLLIDDDENIVFENIKSNLKEELYNFDLMQNSGHIRGWLLEDNSKIFERLNSLYEKKYPQNNTMLYAVGDGNHSLATAKACWENLKKSGVEANSGHPAQYALVEIENIHDSALEFEPIHRIIFNCDKNDLLKKLDEYCSLSETDGEECQGIYSVINGEAKRLYINKPTSNLAVGTLQGFLDEYAKENNCEIDYIHGEEVVKELSLKENSIGFLLPSMEKSDLFKSIIRDGVLPRKTFSMGEAEDKRFYVEARAIREVKG